MALNGKSIQQSESYILKYLNRLNFFNPTAPVTGHVLPCTAFSDGQRYNKPGEWRKGVFGVSCLVFGALRFWPFWCFVCVVWCALAMATVGGLAKLDTVTKV